MSNGEHEHGHSLARLARREQRAYAGDEDRPLGSFVAIMGVYGGAVAALSGLIHASGRRLPTRVSWSDLALATMATHKLSRLLAKDPVTSPLRAPFASFAGRSGDAELAEEVRGGGGRKAVGELVTCPFCLALWVATGFAYGHVLAPGPTRMATSMFSAVFGADVLQLAYAKLQDTAS